ncbi:hypothetical protein F5887DRAFT_964723 [Amanita rubescens]|nr:hypothetical protein F5887DRAFT_964723 [Amanita rubescens]
MKLFSSYTLLLFGFISTVMAIGPLDEPGYITEKDVKHSGPLPKYDDKSGRELDTMARFLRGDWVRMPHPQNLPRIDMMPAVLLPLTAYDFLSFGMIDDQLSWCYITGHMVRSMKLTLDEKPDAEPYAEGAHLESVQRWWHTNHKYAAQLAGYWREARNPNRLIRIIVIQKKSGEVKFLTRALTKDEEKWTESMKFVGVVGV